MTATVLTPLPVAEDKGLNEAMSETYRHHELAQLATVEMADPLERFREQVYRTWLPKLGALEDGVGYADWFHGAEIDGAVALKQYTAHEIRDLRDTDRIHWKESAYSAQVLQKISMPIDPSHSFGGKGQGPVIFVRDEESGVVIVVNGNHRAGAVMMERYNPKDSPLYVVEFSSVEAYEKFAGTSLSSERYLDIEVEQGPRRHS